jgi:hypothetical protein
MDRIIALKRSIAPLRVPADDVDALDLDAVETDLNSSTADRSPIRST